MYKSRILALAMVAAGSVGMAGAVTNYFDGFEDPSWQSNTYGGWNDSDSIVSRQASGDNGIAAFEGGYYGQLTLPAAGGSGAYSRLGGYSSVFGGGFTTSLAIYLDLSVTAGNGFDLTSAASKTDGSHLRDFIFHTVYDGDTILIGGDNNSSNSTPMSASYLRTLNHAEVESSGWYIFQSVFRNDNGVLAVDLNLLDATGSKLWTETRETPADQMSLVGGNRYMWFTFATPQTLAIDNTSLQAVPEPFTMALCAGGLLLALKRRRRR